MKKYINQHKNQNLEIFLKKFPYNEYLKTVQFTDFSRIQEDRFLIWKNLNRADGRKDGDEFLYYLADYFLKAYPVTTNQLNDKTSIGEAYLNPNKTLRNPSQPNLGNNAIQKANTDEVYQIIGYYILSEVATKIENDIKNKKIKGNDPTIQSYINRLKNNKVIVSIEESSTQKIISNVKQGRLDYLWDRAKIKIRPILCKFGFWMWGIVAIFIVSTFLKFVPKAIKIIIFPFAVLLIVFKITIPYSGNTSIVSSTTSPNFKQIPLKNIHRLNNNEHLVNIYQLKSGSGKPIGYSIWLKRPQIKATYYAFEPSKNLRKYQNVVLATTGGYTTSNASGVKPDGFTVQNGELSNAILLHDRQGLVLFAKGGIRVLDLKSKITLPNGDVLESPYNSILSYSKLLNWCKTNKATIFQSHLLAYSDSILINPSKAPSTQRERRLLALFSDKQGNVIHAIFDIREPYDLAVITQEIFNIIASRKLKVEGIVNLDTGSYNILNIFDERGNIVKEVMAPVSISDATNLIIYYK
jgi:hypothetical protein